MTNRERLLAALDGGPLDRIPVRLLFPYHSLGCYADVSDVIEECRGRRFILSPTAGPYEETVDPNVTRNYHEFLDAAWEYGQL